MELVYRKILKIEKVLTTVLEYIIAAAFFVILSLTIILVFLRYFFGTSILGGGGNELIEFLFIYTTALGAVISIGKREHIKIDFFLSKLRQPFRLIVDSFGQMCVAAINIYITILSFHWIRVAGSSPASVLRFPMWIVQVIIPTGCLFVTLFALFNIIKIINEGLVEMKEGPREEHDDSAEPEVNAGKMKDGE